MPFLLMVRDLTLNPLTCGVYQLRNAVPCGATGSDGICAGYASMASGAQECILYGPGMSGSCSTDPSVISPEACAALGTCSDATKTTEATCGVCSDRSAADTTCGVC